MSIRVKFFASLREEVGLDEIAVDADSIAALLTQLAAQLGDDRAAPLRQENIRIAVNHELITEERELAPGDEVAFMPPVTGG